MSVKLTGKFNPRTLKSVGFGLPPIDVSDGIPVWVTKSGSLGEYKSNTDVVITLEVTDPNDNIKEYSIVSGSLPSGLLINQYDGTIGGRLDEVTERTDYNFIVKVVDYDNNAATQSFSITVTPPVEWVTPEGSLGEVDTGGELETPLLAV